jgi:hypothetical protein
MPKTTPSYEPPQTKASYLVASLFREAAGFTSGGVTGLDTSGCVDDACGIDDSAALDT